jgi:SAM-dependent methyltransferase
VTQNVYDRPDFFAGYSALPRSVDGLGSAPEWPTLRQMLPELRKCRAVDLGCGFGWFCRFAREAGAAQVLGLDVSANMLARARATTVDAAIEYRRADLETVDLPEAAFDLAYSSLAFHYLENLDRLFATVHRALVPGGRFVFSVEHPLMTAPGRPQWTTENGRHVWPVDRYLAEGPRTTDWLATGVIKQHRTIASYLDLLLDRGFRILRLVEWGPSDAQVAAHPEWAPERERPPFLLVSAGR